MNADGIFGLKTTNRVREFQGNNALEADGPVGPKTMGLIQDLLKKLGLLPPDPPVTPSAVRPINKDILGLEGQQNLIEQIIPPIALMSEATYQRNVSANRPFFRSTGGTVGRLGIFAANKGGVDRAVILLLPKTGIPDTTLICITQGFAQAQATLDRLGWGNPLSPALIQFCLLKHVINRWGAQMLASRKQMAFVYIVRARGNELGPFANDGAFVKQVLSEMSTLTGNAFGFQRVEAMTFSSGIGDFNRFLASLSGNLNLSAIYSIDPAGAVPAAAPNGVARREFLSGQTGRGGAGFDFVPLDRWQNEFRFTTRTTFPDPWPFNYLHNHCMPLYALHLGLQTI